MHIDTDLSGTLSKTVDSERSSSTDAQRDGLARRIRIHHSCDGGPAISHIGTLVAETISITVYRYLGGVWDQPVCLIWEHTTKRCELTETPIVV